MKAKVEGTNLDGGKVMEKENVEKLKVEVIRIGNVSLQCHGEAFGIPAGEVMLTEQLG